MKKFILIYKTTQEAYNKMKNSTQEDSNKRMKAWFDWRDSLGDYLVDFGAPFEDGILIDALGNETKRPLDITGYTIITAKDIDGALAITKKHPHFNYHPDCTIQVHEFFEM